MSGNSRCRVRRRAGTADQSLAQCSRRRPTGRGVDERSRQLRGARDRARLAQPQRRSRSRERKRGQHREDAAALLALPPRRTTEQTAFFAPQDQPVFSTANFARVALITPEHREDSARSSAATQASIAQRACFPRFLRSAGCAIRSRGICVAPCKRSGTTAAHAPNSLGQKQREPGDNSASARADLPDGARRVVSLIRR